MDNTHLDPATTPTKPVAAGEEPRALGSYRVLRRLGSGGMGAVYLAYDENLNRKVAIKVLGEHLSSSQGFIDRFTREARSGGILNHPNIVRNLAHGQDSATGKHYIVLEFIDGGSAHALLDRQGKLAIGDAVHITLAVARALEHAHARQLVHRDIKPDNILLSRAGVTKLSDFGLVRRTDEPSHLTATRQGFGTTPYMPYEQAMKASKADGRSDIYALGATLYHLVTGVLPFPGENHLDVVNKKGRGHFEPASSFNPSVPPALDLILSRMMARDPIDRYQTASELIIDLERSRLAAAVPSFADPAEALKDPWMQDQLSSAEPTRPYLLSAGEAGVETPPDHDPVWQLRYRDEQGRWCRARASTQVIQRRLRRGRLPRTTQARRPPEIDFKPVDDYPEFRGLRPKVRKTIAARAEADRVEPAAQRWPYALAIGIPLFVGLLKWLGFLPF